MGNGIALCGDNKKDGHACHRLFHVTFKGGTRRKCTRADWVRFVELFGRFRGMKVIERA